MLLDGYEAGPIHRAAVLIDGERIVRVGPAAEMTIPPDYTVVDTSGRTMMPGMIELHGHLIILGHGNYGTWFPWIAKNGGSKMLTKVMETSAKQLLLAGVTSVVDLGAPLAESLSVRDRVTKGEIPGPRLSMSGPWITRSSGGMTEQFGGITVTSSAQAAQEVERLAKAGVDVIKAHSGLTREDYKNIADTAHKHGIRVHAHVYAEEDVRNALETGIDVLTHAGSAGTAPPYSQKMVTDIVNAGRPVVITAAHRSWIYPDTADFPERLQDPSLKRDFPPEIYAEVQDSLKNWRALGYFAPDRSRDGLPRAGGEAVHRGRRGDRHGHRLGHADELPQRGAVARGQGARRHGNAADQGDLVADAHRRQHSREAAGSREPSSPASSPTSSS